MQGAVTPRPNTGVTNGISQLRTSDGHSVKTTSSRSSLVITCTTFAPAGNSDNADGDADEEEVPIKRKRL